MAQGMVTDFFSRKKRSDPFQPSKRRKVLKSSAEGEQKISVAGLTDFKVVDEASESSKLKQNSEGLTTPQFSFSLKTVEPVLTISSFQSKTVPKTNTSTTSKRRTSTKSRASARKKSVSHGPLDKVLARAAAKSNLKDPVKLNESEEPTSEGSEVTSVADDHDVALPKSLPGTPTKRSQKNSDAPIRRKRRKPVLSDEVAPEKNSEAEPEVKQETTNKSRQKRCASSRSKACASAKKSLDKTFQKYENKVQTSQAVKKEVSMNTSSQWQT